MPKISICIPVYNAESTLLKALDSVYRQGFTDWEIIVVNVVPVGMKTVLSVRKSLVNL